MAFFYLTPLIVVDEGDFYHIEFYSLVDLLSREIVTSTKDSAVKADEDVHKFSKVLFVITPRLCQFRVLLNGLHFCYLGHAFI